MTEMLGKFIHEALECLILIPATVLYFLLMKDRMKYPLKKSSPAVFRHTGGGRYYSFRGSGTAPYRSHDSILYPVDTSVLCLQGYCRYGYCKVPCNIPAVFYNNEFL